MTTPTSDKSLGELVATATKDLSLLVQQEVALAKAEIKRDVAAAGKGAGLFGGAGFAGLFALVFLSIAPATASLGSGMPLGCGLPVVGVLYLLVAAAVARPHRQEEHQPGRAARRRRSRRSRTTSPGPSTPRGADRTPRPSPGSAGLPAAWPLEESRRPRRRALAAPRRHRERRPLPRRRVRAGGRPAGAAAARLPASSGGRWRAPAGGPRRRRLPRRRAGPARLRRVRQAAARLRRLHAVLRRRGHGARARRARRRASSATTGAASWPGRSRPCTRGSSPAWPCSACRTRCGCARRCCATGPQLRALAYIGFFQLPRAARGAADPRRRGVRRRAAAPLGRPGLPGRRDRGALPRGAAGPGRRPLLAGVVPLGGPLPHPARAACASCACSRAGVGVPTLQLHGALDTCLLPSTAHGSGAWVDAPYELQVLDGRRPLPARGGARTHVDAALLAHLPAP